MNKDIVKQIFLKEAYQWSRKTIKTIKVKQDIDKEHIDTLEYDLLNNPFYHYTALMKSLAIKRPLNLKDFDNVLGQSLPAIEAEIKQQNINEFKYVAVNGKAETLRDKYVLQSYLAVLEYIQKYIYNKSVSPQHIQVKEYLERQEPLLKMEKEYFHEIAKTKARPSFAVDLQMDISRHNEYRQEKLNLSNFYCSDTSSHETGSYIYKAKNRTVELTKDDIISWIENDNQKKIKEFSTMILINERCKKCKKLIRQHTGKKDKKFDEKLKNNADVIAFYKYYEQRCPASGLHDIVKQKCTKCGLKTDEQTSNQYYKKHLPKFKKVEKQTQELNEQKLQGLQKSIKRSHDFIKEFKARKKVVIKYKKSLKNIAEWSKISKTKYNILVNLGLSEQHKFTLIKQGKMDPSKQLTEETDPNVYTVRALRLKQYILRIIRKYNTLLNYELVSKLPLSLREILNAQKKITLVKMNKLMPEIGKNFTKLDEQYKYDMKPIDYSNFLLEYLAYQFILLNKVDKKYKLMGKMLIDYFTKDILKNELMFSKPKPKFISHKPITAEEHEITNDLNVSGDEYLNNVSAVESPAEFSDVEREPEIMNDVQNFNDAFDVENINDIWDVE